MANYLYIELLDSVVKYTEATTSSTYLGMWKKGEVLRVEITDEYADKDLGKNLDSISYYAYTYFDKGMWFFKDATSGNYGLYTEKNLSGSKIKLVYCGKSSMDSLFLKEPSVPSFTFSQPSAKYSFNPQTTHGEWPGGTTIELQGFDVNGVTYYETYSSEMLELEGYAGTVRCTVCYVQDKATGYYGIKNITTYHGDVYTYGVSTQPKPSTIDINDPTKQKATNASDDQLNDTIADLNESDYAQGESIYSADGTIVRSNEYDPDIEEFLHYGTDDWVLSGTEDNSFYDIKSVLGIFGLPYQFMPHVDCRIDPTDARSERIEGVGADYAEKIIANMPLLFISPGKPAFMTGYNSDEKKTVLENIIREIRGNNSASIDDLISDNGKFYTFEYAVTEYYNYVNPMCRITARLLNLHQPEYSIGDNGENNDNINWMHYTQRRISSITSFATDYLAIPFYIDTDTQISENMSNDVTDSSLAGTVDSFSDMGRELMYYLGYTPAMAGFDSLSDADLLDNAENLRSYISSIDSGNIFKSLLNQITAVASGGRLEFPKIWSSSSFARSYEVNIKLRSPDMDNLSLWTNIIVPLCHIIGLVQPRMINENPNAHTSPFLVRAMYKGFFNVDMGIITSCNISKGDDAQWSINGIPTTVDVSLTITDLYDIMSITAGSSGRSWSFDTLDNTAQMDYLMNMCGINMYKPEIGRLIDLWYTTNIENRLSDAFTVNMWGTLRQKITGSITNIYRGL